MAGVQTVLTGQSPQRLDNELLIILVLQEMENFFVYIFLNS